MIKNTQDIISTTEDHSINIILLIVGILLLYLYRTGKYQQLKGLFGETSKGSTAKIKPNSYDPYAPANPFNIPKVKIEKGTNPYKAVPEGGLPSMGYEVPKK